MVDTQYRLSHSVDSGSSPYQNPFYEFNVATQMGTSDYDVRHAFKVFGVWSPTIFKGSHSWVEKGCRLVGGLSGILNAHTGIPMDTTILATVFLPPVATPCSGSEVQEQVAHRAALDRGSFLQPLTSGGFEPDFEGGGTVDAHDFLHPSHGCSGHFV